MDIPFRWRPHQNGRREVDGEVLVSAQVSEMAGEQSIVAIAFVLHSMDARSPFGCDT